MTSLGIDIGATKIAAGVVDRQGVVLSRAEIPTQAVNSEMLAKQLEDLIRSVASGHKFESVGIGSAGPIDVGGGSISPVNIPLWRNFPIVKEIREVCETNNVTLMGDVVASVFGEFKCGNARSAKNVLGLVVSTGIGGGLVINGEVHNGSTFNAGFIGHTSIAGTSIECECGGIGCLEAISSGPSMVKLARANGLHLSENAQFEEVADAAREGNQIALDAIYVGVDALAMAAANASALLDLDCIVLGGGVAESGDIFWKPLDEAFARRKKHNTFLAVKEISPCALGRNAGIIGAALYSLKE